MSRVLYKTLIDVCEQWVQFNLDERVSIAGFYPYLVMVNQPPGNFEFQFESESAIIFSKTFTSEDIKAAMNTTNGSAHVFFPIVPDKLVHVEKGLYKVRIIATDYFPSRNYHLGWAQQFENIQADIAYEVHGDADLPLAIRIKTHERGIR